MRLITKVTCFAIFFLALNECDAPRRALITIGEPKEDTERVAGRKKTKQESDTYSSQNSKEPETNRRQRETGNANVIAFDLGYKSIIDKETLYKWEPYFDNPSSMIRFQMEAQADGKRLPRFEELTYFFDKLGSELRTNSNGEVSDQLWLQMDGNYISSTEVYTPDNKKLYRGVYWNYTTKSFESVNLAAGDLVNIVLISQQ